MECHDQYVSTSKHRHCDRRKDGVSDLHEKSVAYARLLAQAPDLLGRSEPLHDLGIALLFLFLNVAMWDY